MVVLRTDQKAGERISPVRYNDEISQVTNFGNVKTINAADVSPITADRQVVKPTATPEPLNLRASVQPEQDVRNTSDVNDRYKIAAVVSVLGFLIYLYGDQ